MKVVNKNNLSVDQLIIALAKCENIIVSLLKLKIKVMLGSIIYLVVLVGVLSIVKYFIFKFLD